MNLNTIFQKINSFLFLTENNNLDWIKVVRNALLIYLTYFYINIWDKFWTVKQSDSSSGGGIFESLLIYINILFVLFIIFFAFFKNKYIRILSVILFAIMVILYFRVTPTCWIPLCYFNPYMYFPIPIAFFFVFKNVKYFNLLFVLLILIPSAIVSSIVY